jgi:DNA uptake protein ComE-like DNA-binding protein
VISSVALVVCLMFAQESADLQAVKEVCGKCHAISVFLDKPRSWERWNDVFADMTRRGADGTTEQLALVTRYFLQNLTLVNVNTSPAEELGWVLEVSDDVVATIVERRQLKTFANLAQLKALPGIDAAKLEQRKTRIAF